MNRLKLVIVSVLAIAASVPLIVTIAPHGASENPDAATPVVPATPVSTPSPQATGPRIEIQSQTSTALSIRVFDTTNAQLSLNFARTAPGDSWKTDSSGSLGIIFGNTEPRYAGRAVRRSLGLTAQQSLRTFDSSIATRTFTDVTVFKTYSGMAIGLWQGRVITEIWYVGTLVDQAIQEAQENPDPDGSMCAAVRALCCRQTDGEPNPNMDSCAAALQCPSQLVAACACLDVICAMCVPGPQPPFPPCAPEKQALAERACNMGAPVCQPPAPPPPPPPPPKWVDDLQELLREILERLQEIIDVIA